MSETPSRRPTLAAAMAVALVVTGCLAWLLVGGCDRSPVRVSLKNGVVRCGPFDWIEYPSEPVSSEMEPVAWAPGR